MNKSNFITRIPRRLLTEKSNYVEGVHKLGEIDGKEIFYDKWLLSDEFIIGMKFGSVQKITYFNIDMSNKKSSEYKSVNFIRGNSENLSDYEVVLEKLKEQNQ